MNNKKTTSTPFWRNRKVIPIILQLIFVVLLGIALLYVVNNVIAGVNQIGLTLGLNYLNLSSSFPISESLISFTPADPYHRALLVGLLNTLRVSFFGIILATVVGVIVGIARLSNNWLVSKVARVYVEVFRNTPLLLQIFIWNFAVFLPLPGIADARSIGPFYFSNRGASIPWLEAHNGTLIWLILLAVFLAGAILVGRRLIKREEELGKSTHPFLASFGVFAVACLAAYLIMGNGPFTISVPEFTGNAFAGGISLSIGFMAVLIALSIYTSTYISEIVRAGITGVPKGQTEATRALGLKNSTALRLVIFPQAIRIIIPPLTSQYLNLIKNSSLAMAVGYQEIVGVGNTVINQTGHTLETIFIIILVYLTFSLLTSLFMNFFNKKFQLVER